MDFDETTLFDEAENRLLPSPFNYTGSKYKLMPVLYKHIPKDTEELYDLFCGGGSFFINCHDFNKIHANDIIVPLIEFYKFLQENEWLVVYDEIMKRKITNRSQDGYLLLRQRFNSDKNPVDLFLLCCSCTNNMMRFNKRFEFNQTWGKRAFNKNTENKLYEYHKRIYKNKKMTFLNKNFCDITVENKKSLVYLDPPYMITCAGYNCYWSNELECKLYDYIDVLNNNGIKFLMSNVMVHKGAKNPFCDRIKKYDVVNVDFDYDKVSRSGSSNSQEIIVKNY